MRARTAYRKLGQVDSAREHLEHGHATADALDDGYSRMVKGGLDRSSDRLQAADGDVSSAYTAERHEWL